MYGLGVGATLPVLLNRTSAALAAQALEGTSMETSPERILVVVELSGGNDGLNTVVPFGDDEYYRARPTIGIPRSEVIEIEDGYVKLPQGPGWGVTLNEALVAQHPYQSWRRPVPAKADGGFGYY